MPPPPITLEQMQSFTAPMLSRNPELHFVFARMGMAEEQGLGLGSLRDRAKELELPLPRYIWDAPYLVFKLYRSKEAAATTLDQDVLKSLSKAEQRGWQWIATQRVTAAQEYADAMSIPKRTAQNHLKHFTELGLIKPTGSGPATRYEVVSG
jgi:ATP-dependent DNA helicase RecG